MTGNWIVVGDATSSGGQVVTGSPFTDVDGSAVARVNDTATCPSHNGTFPIVDGDPTTIIDGQPVALHGSKLACGCTLISVRQLRVFVGNAGGGSAVGASAVANAAAVDVGAVADSQAAAAGTHVHSGDGGRHVVDANKARDVVAASNVALDGAGAYRTYATEEEAARTWAGIVLPIANSTEFGVEVGAVITRKDGKYLLGRAYSTGSPSSCDALPERGPRAGGQPTGYIHTHPEAWGFIGRDRGFKLGEFPTGRDNIGGTGLGSDLGGDLVAAYGLQWNAYIAEPGRVISWNFQRYVELQKRGLYDLSPGAQIVRLGEAEGEL